MTAGPFRGHCSDGREESLRRCVAACHLVHLIRCPQQEADDWRWADGAGGSGHPNPLLAGRTVSPKVAIVTPTYQHARLLGACIGSVLQQSLTEWEMVIVDDGSDDRTAEVAESYADPRIRVIRRPHRGLAALGDSYSAALSGTTAPLVAILEGDDMWPRSKLEVQVKLMEEDRSAVLSYGPALLIDDEGVPYALHRHAPRGLAAMNRPLGSIILPLVKTDFLVTSTVVIRREALEAIGGFVQPPGIPYVDLPTWLRLATTGPFTRSDQVLGYWRRHSQQWTIQNVFGAVPDRRTYLLEAADRARPLLSPTQWSRLVRTIEADAARQEQESAISRARLALIEGRWKDAFAMWRALLFTGEIRTRAVAGLGLACSAARTDVEWAIRLAGRHAYPSRRHLRSRSKPGK